MFRTDDRLNKQTNKQTHEDLRPYHTVPHRPTHEKQMTLNARKTITLTKLPNDERQVKGSKGHESIFDGYKRMPKNVIRISCVGLWGVRVTAPIS